MKAKMYTWQTTTETVLTIARAVLLIYYEAFVPESTVVDLGGSAL